MCGIAGILRIHPQGDVPPAHSSIPDSWLDLLDTAIAHRGPDGAGRFRDRAMRADGRVADVALVHRRLAIIDPVTGAQPLVTGHGPDVRATVFNGCIYNHRSLRQELEKAGRSFTTDHSDTEVIPHAHAVWGDHAPARLDGMFAYAIWSRTDASLVVARDFAGEKPLYEATIRNARGGTVYVFASTAAAVARWVRRFESEVGGGGDRLSCNPASLATWLRLGGSLVPLMEQVDECDVRVVSRFETQSNDAGEQYDTSCRDWYADLPVRRDGDEEISPQAVDALIGRAVRSRLESDVDLGCFLSGGVDSSLVAWHAARAAQEAGRTRLRTFTVQMPDARYDESGIAGHAAKVIGTAHESLACDARPAEHLSMLIEQLGLPFADSSLLPTYWVSAAARRHVKVALTGDGGDELFAGYERYRAAEVLRRSNGLLRLLPGWLGAGAHPKSMPAKLGRLGMAARGGYDELLAVFPRPMLAALAPGLTPAIHREQVQFPADAPRRDFEWYLPGDLLRKVDTGAMSVALETRAPFLAREVVDFGLSIPLDTLSKGGRKGLLRAAARLHLPGEVVDRPKMGFAIPISDWFRTDFGGMRTLLMDAVTSAEAFPVDLLRTELDRIFITRLMDEHARGVRDHGQRLYLLLVLALWCRAVRRW